MRAFCRDTGIDPSTLCRILKGDINPSLKVIEKIMFTFSLEYPEVVKKDGI